MKDTIIDRSFNLGLRAGVITTLSALLVANAVVSSYAKVNLVDPRGTIGLVIILFSTITYAFVQKKKGTP